MDVIDLAYASLVGLLLGMAGARALRHAGRQVADWQAILLAFAAAVLGSLVAGAVGVGDTPGFEPVERLLQTVFAGATLLLTPSYFSRTPQIPPRTQRAEQQPAERVRHP